MVHLYEVIEGAGTNGGYLGGNELSQLIPMARGASFFSQEKNLLTAIGIMVAIIIVLIIIHYYLASHLSDKIKEGMKWSGWALVACTVFATVYAGYLYTNFKKKLY